MIKRWATVFVIAGAVGVPGLALSQSASESAPPASLAGSRYGSVGDRTGSISTVGQTKPPGSAVGEGRGTSPELERKSRAIDRMIAGGICRGC